MRDHLPHRSQAGLLAVAVAAGFAMLTTPLAVSATVRAVRVGRASRPVTVPSGTSVLLLTGQQIEVTELDGGHYAVGRMAGGSADPAGGAAITVGLGPLAEYIPLEALPYLGRGLDPSLFNLASLESLAASGRPPVRLTFAGREPNLPGVTITRWSGRTASGFLTAASARTFGRALVRQYAADHSRASYGADGLFADGVSVSLAGTASAGQNRPAFPMGT